MKILQCDDPGCIRNEERATWERDQSAPEFYSCTLTLHGSHRPITLHLLRKKVFRRCHAPLVNPPTIKIIINRAHECKGDRSTWVNLRKCDQNGDRRIAGVLSISITSRSWGYQWISWSSKLRSGLSLKLMFACITTKSWLTATCRPVTLMNTEHRNLVLSPAPKGMKRIYHHTYICLYMMVVVLWNIWSKSFESCYDNLAN
jgi:hypothetical protein